MSSTVDYIEDVIVCPDCGEPVEVTIIREQDNRTCEVNTSLSKSYTCPECHTHLTKEDL